MQSPRVLVIQHDRDDALNDLAGPLIDAGLSLDTWCTWIHSSCPYDFEDFDGVISMGANASVLDIDSEEWIAHESALLQTALEREIPILGVCFGSQILAHAAGGQVRKSERIEIGWCDVSLEPAAAADPLFSQLGSTFTGMQFHYDTFDLPDHATVLARGSGLIQGFKVGRNAWATQFHIEANPSIVYGWLGTYRNEIDKQNIDVEALRDVTARYWREHSAISSNFASAFATVVRENAHEKILST